MTIEEASALHADLSKKLKSYSEQYYLFDAPSISDAEYDELYKQLRDLEIEFPELISSSGITSTVGIDIRKSQFEKIKHISKMLSLDNAYSEEDILAFFQRAKKGLKIDHTPECVLEAKLDGLSASLRYENGRFVSAATRGDGFIGEDVSENIKHVRGFVQTIPYNKTIEIRGEVIMKKDSFAELNRSIESQGGKPFANPRNAAAGSLRQLDASITKQRELQFYAYSIVGDHDYLLHSDVLKALADFGFDVNPVAFTCGSLDAMISKISDFERMRATLLFDIDGVVFKINDLQMQRTLGESSKYPRHSIAYKFPAEMAKSKLIDISVQVGRTGVITPVANIEPVNIGGVLISKASIHNKHEIVRKNLRIGDIVYIKRAGDVIPQIYDVAERCESSTEFIFPKNCPCCGIELIDVNQSTVCPNNAYCVMQIKERLKHFVSRDAMNIMNLGDKNIDALVDNQFVLEPYDLFTLEDTVDDGYDMFSSTRKIDLIVRKGILGKVMANKILNAINERRNVELYRFIYAFGIPLIGNSIARLMAEHYKTFGRFFEQCKIGSFDELADISGIGSGAINALNSHFANPYFADSCIKFSKIFDKSCN